MKKLALFPAIFGLLLSGCSLEDLMFWKKNNDTPSEKDDEGKDDTTVHVSSVSLNKSSTSIVEDSSETLTCTVLPENASNKAVTWSTSNSDVASVANGVVRGVSAGTATITVASLDGNKTATCAVTVTEKQTPEVHVTSVLLNKDQLSLEEMQSETLTCTVFPTDATNKAVTWSISDPLVASVTDGVVYANNPGTATITVASVDGNKTATCALTVTAKVPEVKTITSTLDFTEKYYSKSNQKITAFTLEQEIDENVSVTFSKGEAPTNSPECYAYNKTTAVRVYPGNQLTVTSKTEDIKKIEFTYQSAKDTTSNVISSEPEGFSVDTWNGSGKEVIFTAENASGGCRAITSIKVTYEGENDPEEDINLGVKSIAEVREYIAEHPVKKNSFGNGVNEHRTVTIKGFALAKINLEKSKSEYGLDVSEFGKIIMADSTGYIGVASKVSGEGTSLYGKVGTYTCTDTARYVITGYLSEYLGHPEILVTSFTWNSNLDVTWDASVISDATVTIDNFYNKAKDVYYNCAGHAYGEVLTLNNLKLYYTEADGQGVRYYNFTDGEKNIRVNAYNLGSVSEGKYYDVVGITSIKNLSPIIVAFKISETVNPEEFTFNFATASETTSLSDLYAVHGKQDDVDTRTERFDDVINAYGKFYKTEVYLTLVEQGGLYYVGITESFLSNVTINKPITGKDNACTNYGVTLIKNQNFWAAEASEIERYNPFFEDYVCENLPLTVYYTVRQQRYVSNTPIWEILLIEDSLHVYSE